MMLGGGAAWPSFGGFLAGAACVWLRGGRIRAELTRTRWIAEHDGLTGLPNREGIQARYDADRRAGCQVSLALLDLDGFKQVNDTLGHQAGDRFLVGVAQRLAQPGQPACVPGRLGGDEFLILLPRTEPAEIAAMAQALLARIAAPITVGHDTGAPATLTATASIGIAAATPEGTWSTQLQQADIALYHAKAHPGGIVQFREGMQHPPCAPGDHGRSRHARQGTPSTLRGSHVASPR
jgi:diguanylate cyclase (GGDEF)-like protein